MVRIRALSILTSYVLAITTIALVLQSVPVLAQEAGSSDLVIEEVIVTAQRREQLAQEVPIAMEAFSGVEMRRQGFRDMDDLANFSPTVLIEPRVQDQDISIRGFGTTGNALTLDQAAPTFIDGIHFGRSSQIRMAFMDVESVEVLKGPQPVYFGMNATAGAFNIRSRRPTESWEGYIDVELADDNTQELAFGVGGPLSDKWGIRVAGKRESTDGYLRDVVTQGMHGGYENTGGRLILQYQPVDRLIATFKVENQHIRKDTETTYGCRTAGPLVFGREGPTDPGAPGDERSVWADAPDGSGWSQAHTPLDTECFSSNNGVSNGGPYYEPPQYIREENSNFGSLDVRAAADGFAKSVGTNGIIGYEDIDANNGYLELAYDLDNGIVAEWLTGWSTFKRDYVQDNSSSPFFMNFQGRGEDFNQYSSELRLTSPGDKAIEWMVGAFWQKTELDGFGSSLRANVRQSQRYNIITEDVDYKSVFATVTVNFLDDKMSLDLGGRYSNIDKHSTVRGYAASWIYDVEPVSAADRGDEYYEVDPATARLYVPVDSGATLWAMPYRESRNVPVEWLSGNASAVGLTAPDFAVREANGEGPWAETFPANEFDPQITLRYRPTDNTSFYLRFAQAFKVGGFDTGQTSIPVDIDELTFESENAETYELGIKGSLMQGRVRYDADFFQVEFPNLQTTALSPDPDQTSASVNAGQRVRGFEFNSQFAATENLRLGLAGAFMNGEMTSFRNAGCTAAELVDPNSGCVLLVPGEPLEGGLIDRTGSTAPRTPEWKFVLSADYFRPVTENIEFVFNAKGFVSDGYIVDVESFSKIVKYNQHGDLNLIAGIRDMDGRWAVSAFARNLLEARPSYNAEYDTNPDGLQFAYVSPSSFKTFGVKFEYFIN